MGVKLLTDHPECLEASRKDTRQDNATFNRSSFSWFRSPCVPPQTLRPRLGDRQERVSPTHLSRVETDVTTLLSVPYHGWSFRVGSESGPQK